MSAAIYGEARFRDGSKVDGTVTISTSWNNEVAYPYNGWYRLDFGENPQRSITVYVDGDRYSNVYVDGETRLDIQVPR